jgi:hypothetical protein
MATAIREAQAHALLAAYKAEFELRAHDLHWWSTKPGELATGRAVLAADPDLQIAVIRVALTCIAVNQTAGFHNYVAQNKVDALISQLCKRALPYTRDDVQQILDALTSTQYAHSLTPAQALLRSLVHPLTDPETLAAFRSSLEQLRAQMITYGDFQPARKLVRLLDEILNGQQQGGAYAMSADEWADQIAPTLGTLDGETRERWVALLRHCATGSGSAPSGRWLATAHTLREQLGMHTFTRLAADWIGAFRKSGNKPPEHDPHTYQRTSAGCLLDESNADVLRGLAWCCAEVEDAALAAALGDAAIAGYRKITGIGPRSAKVAGACVYALKSMSGLHGPAQLERVRLSVKQPTYVKGIAKALNEAARRAGMTRDDLEELTVPTFDLDRDGRRRVPIGPYAAILEVAGTDVLLRWEDAAGKSRKAEPAEVKREHKAELKELKHLRDDVAHMLAAQRDRLERLPLAERQWTLAAWRERYRDHPLVGTLARCLIWHCADAAGTPIADGIWLDGRLVDAGDRPLDLPESAMVTPWHPALREASEVLAWREWLERHQITQPFKQAHREVYLLTEAERATRVYSNRFAAHILRQHQFNALCAARGWRNTLRLMVDDEYPPATLELPHYNLRAEFWIEGAGDQYEVDTNGTGTYWRVATDQVRFYPLAAAEHYAHAGGGGYHFSYRGTVHDPIPLEQIPPLVFTEVMRDVDLFVGVASVGNDPTWQDGGPNGRYRDYWQSYSFGELSATAETRKQLLGRLVPRLTISDRCAVEGRFLRVRGDLRTYKIHLGSGNILMEPNDQYLCIVPGRGDPSAATGDLFLPFEGDSVLAIILSKAFLLAGDTKITDPTITRQLARA